MADQRIKELLLEVANGTKSVEDAERILKQEVYSDLGYAKVDHHRRKRQGMSEVIYGAGKTPEQILGITESLVGAGEKTVLITRMSEEARKLVSAKFEMTYDAISRTAVVGEMPKASGNGKIVVACAGTSDLFVANEAAITAECMGNEVVRLYDVGVAGIHRLFAHMEELEKAQVVIAIAGMEGALASVIGGLVDCPVIAVPTSVGYGANFGGLSALLSMLNSCASGVSVVNIDNGFGAGYLASTINHQRIKE